MSHQVVDSITMTGELVRELNAIETKPENEHDRLLLTCSLKLCVLYEQYTCSTISKVIPLIAQGCKSSDIL